MHAGGVLVYTAPPSLPTELVLRTATGNTIATESLQSLATETQETCEGEEEGRGGRRRSEVRRGERSAPSLYTGRTSGRGGRVAEGTRLLSEYGGQTPSRVRIPPSPFRRNGQS